MNMIELLAKPPSVQPGKGFRAMWDDDLLALEEKMAMGGASPSDMCAAAETRITLWCFGFEPRDKALTKASHEVRRALEIEPDIAMARMMMGVLHLADWRWDQAEDCFRQAIELDEANPWGWHWYALFLAAMGRHDEAMRHSLRSVDIDRSPGLLVGHGSIYYFANRFEELAGVMEMAVAEKPDFAPAYDWLGMAYVQLERFDESIAVYRKAAELSDGLAEILGGLGHAYGVAGRIDEAREVLSYLDACAEHNYIPPVQIAYVAFGMGDDERGFELLEQAYREKSWELAFAKTEPWLLHLHNDPRFQSLLKRIGHVS